MSTRLSHGSVAWWEMVGQLMCDAATRAALPADVNLTTWRGWETGSARCMIRLSTTLCD